MKRRRPTSKRPPKTGHPRNELPRDGGELPARVMDLRQQVAPLTRMLFGRRSEKLPLDDPHPDLLFGRIEAHALRDGSSPWSREAPAMKGLSI